jgi:eukaryotic-like serine/threonine-protein kinase
VLAFQEDLQRYQASQPVLARAGSWRYRTGKFFKRRPLLAPGAALAVAAVAIYLVTITSYSRDLARERALAETTRDFLVRLFESPDPRAPADPERGRNITVVEALEIGRERLLEELADQPELDASLSRAISQVYTSLDQYRPAIELRERALGLEEAIYGADSSLALESMRALSRLKSAVGDHKAAEALTARQLELTQARGERGFWLGLAEYAAAEHALATGQKTAGAELLENAIEEMLTDDRVAAGADGASLLALLNSATSGEGTAAQILTVDELVREALGADAPASLVLQAQAATALSTAGDSAAAEARYDSLIPRMIEVLGENHPDTLSTRNNLAVLYAGNGRYPEAEALHRDLLERGRRVYGEASSAVANGYQNLATAIARQGRFAEAIPLHQRALDTYVEVFAAEHPATVLPLISLSLAHLMLNEADLAAASAGAALARIEAGGGSAELAFTAQCLLGHARIRQNDPDGDALLREARGGLVNAELSAPYESLCRRSI